MTMKKRSGRNSSSKRATPASRARVEKHVAAAEFKARCLELMDKVQRSHQGLVITKHGRPVARLVPYDSEPIDIVGFLAGSLTSYDDVISPLDESWEASG
jgi:prevent-host-death family protein